MSEHQPSVSPPGWYPDDYDAPLEHYWTGSHWGQTREIRMDTKSATAPIEPR